MPRCVEQMYGEVGPVLANDWQLLELRATMAEFAAKSPAGLAATLRPRNCSMSNARAADVASCTERPTQSKATNRIEWATRHGPFQEIVIPNKVRNLLLAAVGWPILRACSWTLGWDSVSEAIRHETALGKGPASAGPSRFRRTPRFSR
jgi:hypothetical protein